MAAPLEAPPRTGLRRQSRRSNGGHLHSQDATISDTLLTSGRAALDVLGTTAPAEPAIGLYLHVPFCALRCHFCSFTTAPFREGAMARYLAALHREIELVATAPWTPDVRLETVFLGGGTPSLLEAGELADILGHLRGTFTIAPEAEITVECNPESVDALKLAD